MARWVRRLAGLWGRGVAGPRSAGPMGRGMAALLSVLLLALPAARALAVAGELDPSFGGDGTVSVDLGSSGAELAALVVQPDGKLVIAGASGAGSRDFFLARYNPDGSVDRGFDGGRVYTDFGGRDGARALVLQPDGRFVAAGFSGGNFALARYRAGGGLDSTFGGGRAFTDFGNPDDEARALAVQSRNRVVVAGAGGGSFLLARYLEDGTIDQTFGEFGRVFTDFGADDGANAVLALPDGKILVAGHSGGNFALARYAEDGTLDTTFRDGRVFTDFGAADVATALVLQPDGKVVAAGRSGDDFALARYNPDGTLDDGFGVSGRSYTDFGGQDGARAVVLLPDGKLIAGGSTSASGDGDFAVTRYNSDGSLDTSFASGGRAFTGFGAQEAAAALALQPDGKVVAAGVSGADTRQLVLTRYNQDGTLDRDFGSSGRGFVGLSGPEQATALAMQADGMLVAAGSSIDNFLLARFTTDGSLDPGFAGGAVSARVGDNGSAHALLIQPDAKIVAAGGGGDLFALTRHNADGTPDTSFGTQGVVTTDLGEGKDTAYGVAQQADGKLVAAGDAGGHLGLVRYNPNGSLDTSFGTQGIVRSDLGNTARANAVGIRFDGAIFVAGTRVTSEGSDFVLALYNSDGSADTSFGTEGVVRTSIGTLAAGYALLLLPDGGLLVGGASDGTFALSRYGPDGSLGGTFGGQNGEIRALALQPDGKVAAAGRACGEAADPLSGEPVTLCDAVVARYTPDGAADEGFLGGGIVAMDLGGGDDAVHGLVLQPDGKLVAAGRIGTQRDQDVALFRLQADAPPEAPPAEEAPPEG